MSQPAVKRQRNTEMLRAPSVRDVGMSMLLLLAGRASVLGLFPFGVAFFASCFDKSIAYLGITVLSIALMTSAGSAVLTKYLVAALLFWIYTRFRNKENLVLDAACVGGAVMVGGFVFLIYTYVGAYDILMLFVEAIVTSLMYIIFKKAHGLIANRKKRTQTAQDELISISVSVGVFITGLSGIVFPYNISLANIVSVYAVLCIALHGGIAAAGSGGCYYGYFRYKCIVRKFAEIVRTFRSCVGILGRQCGGTFVCGKCIVFACDDYRNSDRGGAFCTNTE